MSEESITCATIIGHDLDLLRFCVENARARAGLPHQWLVINWIPADRPEAAAPIETWCRQEGVSYFPYQGEPRPDDPGASTGWFLRQLYACWNLGYSKADTKWVARMGSDQFFSHNWLANLMKAADKFGDRAVYHCWTVESPVAKNSRHEIRPWGSEWDKLDIKRFDQYANDLAHRYSGEKALRVGDCNLHYRHPHRGLQLRPDGCTWLQLKTLWEEFGPLDDVVNYEGVTGDVAYMDRLYDAGVKGFLVPPSTTYHFVRGESREVQH